MEQTFSGRLGVTDDAFARPDVVNCFKMECEAMLDDIRQAAHAWFQAELSKRPLPLPA